MRIGLLSLAAAMVAVAAPASASEMVNFKTVSDTDVASFGIGNLRGTGTGTLAVSGLSGSISSAYLFWHGPTNSTSPTVNANVSFGGQAITGTNIGFSSDNFWGYTNSQAYRADVSGIITGNGNYALSGFRNGSAEINGASLIVFFNDGNAANNHDVVLFDGNDANFSNSYDRDNWNATLSGINYAGGAATMTLHVSDGQNFGSDDDGTLSINGTALATGGLYQGDSVQLGTGGVSNGALWDIKTFDIASRLTPGANTLTLSQNANQDALSLIAVQFNLPVGAAPGAVPEPASWAMMILGMGAIGGTLRRRRGAGATLAAA